MHEEYSYLSDQVDNAFLLPDLKYLALSVMDTLKHPSASVKPANQPSFNVIETALLINRIVLLQNDCLKLELIKLFVEFCE